MATTTRPGEETKSAETTRTAPVHQLILLDDDEHTYEYVIEMLGAVFGYPAERGYQLAKEVDASGRVIIYSGALEVVELKQDQVHSYGADWRIARCVGSMTAIIELAPG